MSSHGRETRRLERTTPAVAIALALIAGCVLTCAPRPARAANADAHHWLALAVLGGSTVFDSQLADYQWDVSPRAAWGASLMGGAGRFGVGTRVWTTTTVQHTGLAVPGGDPTVRSTTWDALGEARVTSALGTDVLLRANVGWLALRYSPDQLSVANPGGGAPIVVDFKPVNEWIGGGAVALRHALPGSWSTGLEVERRVFGLDTAHRNGSVIEERRETFGEWSVRLEVARWFGRR